MKILLFILLVNLIHGTHDNHEDDNSIKLPPKYHYNYDYSVHYCENNDNVTHHYQSEHDNHGYNNHGKERKFRKRLKKLKSVIIAIVMGIVACTVALAEQLS